MKVISQILRPDPKVLYLEPVFGCNYRCFSCIHGSGRHIGTTQLGPGLFEKLKPLIERVKHIHITGLGEPLLNAHLLDYLTYLREKDKSYYINTNGSLITGGRGFLGRYFTRVLSRMNERSGVKPCRVLVLDNMITAGESGRAEQNAGRAAKQDHTYAPRLEVA